MFRAFLWALLSLIPVLSVANSAQGDENPVSTTSFPIPIHVPADLGPNSYVHPMMNIYQKHPNFSDLFAADGQSQICGPAALSNALIYLKFRHAPVFPEIMRTQLPENANVENYVRTLFNTCRTHRETGTFLYSLRDCAREALQSGGYGTENVFVRGIHSDLDGHKVAVSPSDLRSLAYSRYNETSQTQDSDRATVLLMGWYKVEWDAGLGRWVYRNYGRHFVTLAGFEMNDESVFYVSNSLVDYAAEDAQSKAFSKITLQRVQEGASVDTPEGASGLWETADMLQGYKGVVEDALIILPE